MFPIPLSSRFRAWCSAAVVLLLALGCSKSEPKVDEARLAEKKEFSTQSLRLIAETAAYRLDNTDSDKERTQRIDRLKADLTPAILKRWPEFEKEMKLLATHRKKLRQDGELGTLDHFSEIRSLVKTLNSPDLSLRWQETQVKIKAIEEDTSVDPLASKRKVLLVQAKENQISAAVAFRVAEYIEKTFPGYRCRFVESMPDEAPGIFVNVQMDTEDYVGSKSGELLEVASAGRIHMHGQNLEGQLNALLKTPLVQTLKGHLPETIEGEVPVEGAALFAAIGKSRALGTAIEEAAVMALEARRETAQGVAPAKSTTP